MTARVSSGSDANLQLRSQRQPDQRVRRSYARRLRFPFLALLLAALGIFAIAPAQAQTTVWSATLTVDRDDNFYGCDNGVASQDDCSTASVLTDDDFTYGGSTYEIVALIWSSTLNTLSIQFNSLTGAQAKTPLTNLTLTVQGNKLAIADSTASGSYIVWSYDPDTDWTDGLSVSVSLAEFVPDLPTNLGVASADAQLNLTWTAPSGTVTGYDVHYTSGERRHVFDEAAASGNNPASGWVAVNRTGTTASQTISSLTNVSRYRVRVRAKNTFGAGGWVFGAGTPTTAATGTPAAPTNLAVTPGATSLALTWTAPTGTLTGYDVHYTILDSGAFATGSDPSMHWVAVTRSGLTASQTISSLTGNTLYQVRVRATNSTGAGSWAFATGGTTTSAVPRRSDEPGGRSGRRIYTTHLEGTWRHADWIRRALHVGPVERKWRSLERFARHRR